MSNSSLNISQDVGGGTGFNFAFAAIHGGRALDQQIMVNGMSVTSLTGTGGTRSNWSDGTAQEYGILLAGHQAEIAYGGVFANVIPREGANRFSGSLFANFGTEGLQADNLDDDLRARGLTVANKTKKLVDINPSFGGPIAHDKVWFHAAFRYSLTDNYVGGLYYNLTPKAWTYTPDSQPPGDQRSADLRHDAERHVAGVAEEPAVGVRRLRQHVPLPLLDQPDHRAGGRDLQPRRQQHRAGALDVDAHQPPAARGRLLALPQLVPAGAAAGRDRAVDPRAVERTCDSDPDATYFPTPQTVDDYRAVALVRDRRAQPEGRADLLVAVREGSDRVRDRRRQLPDAERHAEPGDLLHDAVSHAALPETVRRLRPGSVHGEAADAGRRAALRPVQELLQRDSHRAGPVAAGGARLSGRRGVELEGPVAASGGVLRSASEPARPRSSSRWRATSSRRARATPTASIRSSPPPTASAGPGPIATATSSCRATR